MSMKYLWVGIGVAVLIPLAAVAWWLLSPLFTSRVVEEELPFSAGAEVPPGMTRTEVEQVMAGMAKVDQPMQDEMPGGSPAVLKVGTFRDADSFHKGSGRATIYRTPDGDHLLRLEDFSVTNGPDLHVILTPNPDPRSREGVHAAGYLDLGSLKGNIGSQNYPIPDDFDPSKLGSVVIYCAPFHVIFSVASLEEPG